MKPSAVGSHFPLFSRLRPLRFASVTALVLSLLFAAEIARGDDAGAYAVPSLPPGETTLAQPIRAWDLALPAGTRIEVGSNDEINWARIGPLTTAQEFRGYTVPTGATITINFYGDARVATGATPLVVHGVEASGDSAANITHDGQVASFTPASEQSIDNVPVAADKMVWLGPTGHVISATLAHDLTRNGLTARGGTEVQFGPDGAFQRIVLGEDHRFTPAGIVAPRGTTVELLPDGSLARMDLPSPTVVHGTPCAAETTTFRPDGGLERCVLARDHRFGRVSLRAGSAVTLDANGRLQRARIEQAQRIAGRLHLGHEEITFDARGHVRAVECQLTYAPGLGMCDAVSAGNGASANGRE